MLHAERQRLPGGGRAAARTGGGDTAAERTVQLILSARAHKRKLLVIGNGGSAATVSHLHNDLTKAVGVRNQLCPRSVELLRTGQPLWPRRAGPLGAGAVPVGCRGARGKEHFELQKPR